MGACGSGGGFYAKPEALPDLMFDPNELAGIRADELLSRAMSASPATEGALKRDIGLWQGTALNIIDMVGIGPFVTLPLILAAMGGGRAIGEPP